MKSSLEDKLSVYLLKKGYTLKILKSSCFDILGRSGSQILLIKILEDANSISEEYATQMNHVAGYITAIPLIIAEKAGSEIYDNVVYSRFGIYTLNFDTFRSAVDNKLPFIRSDHAGLTAHVMGDKVRQLREQRGISLGDISRKIGVSKKMVQMYEHGRSDITISNAKKLYSLFGPAVFQKIDIFKTGKREQQLIKSDIGKKYSSLGFDALETKKVPFDIIAKRENDMILTKIGDKPKPGLESLSKLVDADKLVIFERKKPKDIPAVTKKQFMEFEKARQLIKFVKEF